MARQVPGVVGLGQVSRWLMHYRVGRRINEAGVSVQVVHTAVIVDCYLIAAPETNLLELGFAVQAAVAAAIHEPAGLSVPCSTWR